MAAPIPYVLQQYFDNNGKPLSGGTLETYAAGTNTPLATYQDKLASIPNTNPVQLDAAGRANVWLAPSPYKFVLKNKSGVTIWTIDNVAPNDGGGGGLTDADYAKVGYSNRFSSLVNTTGLNDTLNWIMGFVSYAQPSIVLSIAGSGTIREKGVAISTPNVLSAAITKATNDLDRVRFNRTGTGVIDTQTSSGGIPSGGTSTYSYGTSFSDTTSFTADVRDVVVAGNGGNVVTSNTVTFTFVYPYYRGVGAAGLNAAGIQALTKDVIVSTASVNRSFTVSGSQKMYFAYPASYGDLTEILDVNNFNTILDWTKSTKSFTMADATSQNYTCYEFNNFAVAGSYSYTFKR